MTIVKIDRSTIKPNPNAGSTVTHLRSQKTISFEFPGQGCIPIGLLDKAIISQWQYATPDLYCHQKGIIVNPDDIPLFESIPGITINADEQLTTMHHGPEPDYLFRYEDPIVNCGNCGMDVKASEITSDEFWDGEEDRYVDQICPHCHAHYSFGDIQYESISEAVAG